jgi:ubiquinone/menaquinone biosynthesis C-methylase UbiE
MAFHNYKQYWEQRSRKQGPTYVNNIEAKDEVETQRIAIENLVAHKLTSKLDIVIDFGCGYGRFIPFWLSNAKQVLAVDISATFLDTIGALSSDVTPIVYTQPFQIPMKAESVDLLWAAFAFQHVVEPETFDEAVMELKRLLRRGGRVLLLENLFDSAWHVKARPPELFVDRFGLAAGWQVESVLFDSDDYPHHYLLNGVKE